MTTIYLRGEIGRLFGRRHKLDVKTPAEAARALEANFGRFFKYLYDAKARGVAFQVFVGKESIPEGALRAATNGKQITFAPVLQGADDGGGGGKSGVFNVIIGVIIIAVATVVSQGTLTGPAIAATFGGGGVAAFAANFGLAMALGGVASMIAGKPRAPTTSGERPENTPSYLFNGATNRTRQGNVYPLVYGKMIVGSQRVSASVKNEDYVTPPAAETGGGNGEFDPNSGEYGGYETT